MDDEYYDQLIAERDKIRERLSFVENELKNRPVIAKWKEYLTPEQVREARASRLAGMTVTSIARVFGVHKSTMSRLLRYQLHKSV